MSRLFAPAMIISFALGFLWAFEMIEIWVVFTPFLFTLIVAIIIAKRR